MGEGEEIVFYKPLLHFKSYREEGPFKAIKCRKGMCIIYPLHNICKIVEFMRKECSTDTDKAIDSALKKFDDASVKDCYLAFHEAFGYGPFSAFWNDESIESIFVEGKSLKLIVKHAEFGLCRTNIAFKNMKALKNIVYRIIDNEDHIKIVENVRINTTTLKRRGLFERARYCAEISIKKEDSCLYDKLGSYIKKQISSKKNIVIAGISSKENQKILALALENFENEKIILVDGLANAARPNIAEVKGGKISNDLLLGFEWVAAANADPKTAGIIFKNALYGGHFIIGIDTSRLKLKNSNSIKEILKALKIGRDTWSEVDAAIFGSRKNYSIHQYAWLEKEAEFEGKNAIPFSDTLIQAEF
ncbi:MAG: hypothetical protein ACP5RP_01075 [Candidatus Micrarchaeia archaeon]